MLRIEEYQNMSYLDKVERLKILVTEASTNEILPLNWTATKIRNLVVDYEKGTQKIYSQLQG